MPHPEGKERVLVFAKAPQPGAVKTRLIPVLGAPGAAELHARLVEHTLATACAACAGALELHCAPDAADPFFQRCGGRYGVALATQHGSDLGERMHCAFVSTLATAARVILIGTDCPALTARHLRQAQLALADGNDAVFVPAEDGGYALIGLARNDARLFQNIPWGGAQVMAQTRERLRSLHWRWHELDTLWDVDRPADYRRLVQSGLLAAGSAHA
jgi:rSAM/selenodomain-associated transferase 1